MLTMDEFCSPSLLAWYNENNIAAEVQRKLGEWGVHCFEDLNYFKSSQESQHGYLDCYNKGRSSVKLTAVIQSFDNANDFHVTSSIQGSDWMNIADWTAHFRFPESVNTILTRSGLEVLKDLKSMNEKQLFDISSKIYDDSKSNILKSRFLDAVEKHTTVSILFEENDLRKWLRHFGLPSALFEAFEEYECDNVDLIKYIFDGEDSSNIIPVDFYEHFKLAVSQTPCLPRAEFLEKYEAVYMKQIASSKPFNVAVFVQDVTPVKDSLDTILKDDTPAVSNEADQQQEENHHIGIDPELTPSLYVGTAEDMIPKPACQPSVTLKVDASISFVSDDFTYPSKASLGNPKLNEKYTGYMNRCLVDNGGKLADSLFTCLYNAYFEKTPHDLTVAALWVEAVRERENGAHGRADDLILRALSEEFWLPPHHACLWRHAGRAPLLVPRIEYEAVLQFLDIDSLEISSDIKTAVKDVMSQSFNDPELANYHHRWCWLEGNQSKCVSLKKNDKVVTAQTQKSLPPVTTQCGCLSHHQLSQLGKSRSSICSYDHQILLNNDTAKPLFRFQARTLWDPLIWVKNLQNWPRPDKNHPEKHPFQCSNNSEKMKYLFFTQNESHVVAELGISKFPLPVEAIMTAMEKRIGKSGNPKHTNNRDVFEVLQDIFDLRTGNSHETVVDIDNVWSCIDKMLNFVDVLKSQAEAWIRCAGKKYIPNESDCHQLIHCCEEVRALLHENLHEQSRPRTGKQHDLPYYSEFAERMGNFEADGPILVLIAPPLEKEHLPCTLAKMHWTVVVDLHCIDQDLTDDESEEKTSSVLWKHFSENGSNILDKGKIVSATSPLSYVRKTIRSESCPWNIGLPWIFPLLEGSSDGSSTWKSIAHHYRPQQRVEPSEAKDIQRGVSAQISALIEDIFARAKNQAGKTVEFVIPLYGPRFSCPRKEGKANSVYYSVDSMKNFAIPAILKRVIKYINSESKGIPTRINILYDDWDADEQIVGSFLEYSDDDDGIALDFFSLPPNILDLRFDKSKPNFVVFKNAVNIYGERGSEEIPFSSHYKRGQVAGQLQERNQLEKDSSDNFKRLYDAGLELLHLNSPAESLQGDQNQIIVAIMKFSFAYPPIWALLDIKFMEDEFNGLCNDFIVGREVMGTLCEKARKAYDAQPFDKTKNTIIVSHAPRVGCTTILREFAWRIAFRDWKAAVLYISKERIFNEASKEYFSSISHLIKLLSDLTQNPVVVIADDGVREVALDQFREIMSQNYPSQDYPGMNLLFIRAQRTTRSDKNLFFKQSVHSVDIDEPNEREIGNLIRIIRTLKSHIDKKDFEVESLKRMDEIEHKRWRPLTGFIYFASFTDPEFKNVYENITRNWLNEIVKNLYDRAREEKERTQATRAYSSLSAIRSMTYLALIQMCLTNQKKEKQKFSGIHIDSFRTIMADEGSDEWLFASSAHYLASKASSASSASSITIAKSSSPVQQSTPMQQSSPIKSIKAVTVQPSERSVQDAHKYSDDDRNVSDNIASDNDDDQAAKSDLQMSTKDDRDVVETDHGTGLSGSENGKPRSLGKSEMYVLSMAYETMRWKMNELKEQRKISRTGSALEGIFLPFISLFSNRSCSSPSINPSTYALTAIEDKDRNDREYKSAIMPASSSQELNDVSSPSDVTTLGGNGKEEGKGVCHFSPPLLIGQLAEQSLGKAYRTLSQLDSLHIPKVDDRRITFHNIKSMNMKTLLRENLTFRDSEGRCTSDDLWGDLIAVTVDNMIKFVHDVPGCSAAKMFLDAVIEQEQLIETEMREKENPESKKEISESSMSESSALYYLTVLLQRSIIRDKDALEYLEEMGETYMDIMNWQNTPSKRISKNNLRRKNAPIEKTGRNTTPKKSDGEKVGWKSNPDLKAGDKNAPIEKTSRNNASKKSDGEKVDSKSLKAGDKVEVKFGGKKWYSGTIFWVREDGTYDIRYDEEALESYRRIACTLSWNAQHIFIARNENFSLETRGEKHEFSWLLEKVYNKNECGLDNNAIILLIGAFSIFPGYWRITSSLCRFLVMMLEKKLKVLKEKICTHPNPVMMATDALVQGAHIYLAATDRLLLGESEVSFFDLKKRAGNNELLGNTIRAFMDLATGCHEVCFKTLRENTDFDNVSAVREAILELLAFGNIARYFYTQAHGIMEQGATYNDEILLWLRLLEAARDLGIAGGLQPNWEFDVNDIEGKLNGLLDNLDCYTITLEDMKRATTLAYSTEQAFDFAWDKLLDLHEYNLYGDMKDNEYQKSSDRETAYLKLAFNLDENFATNLQEQFHSAAEDIEKDIENATDRSKVPSLQKRYVIFATRQFEPIRSTAERLSNREWHIQWLNRLKTQRKNSQRKTLRKIVKACIDCYETLQYPPYIMISLLEMVAFIVPEWFSRDPEGVPEYYKISKLQIICNKWYAHSMSTQIDMQLALRVKAILLFISIWARCSKRFDGTEIFSSTIDKEEEKNAETFMDAIAQLSQHPKNIRHHPVYTLCRPPDYNWKREAIVDPPLCIRRRFSQLHEAEVEAGIHKQDAETPELQIVYGKCVEYDADKCAGKVCLEGCPPTLELPFTLPKGVRPPPERVRPAKDRYVTFYVDFLDDRVCAVSVQSTGQTGHRVDLRIKTVEYDPEIKDQIENKDNASNTRTRSK